MKMVECYLRSAMIAGLVASAAAVAELQDATTATSQAPHIILFVGDGMHLEHEIAASRYLYGEDSGLSFHQLPYNTHVTTWDINTYNAFAWWLNKPAYTPDTFDPLVGYNPAQGGAKPYPLDKTGSDAYFLTALHPMGYLGAAMAPATDSASSATALATGKKTVNGRIAWGEAEDSGPLTTIAEKMRAQLDASIGVVSTVPFNHATPASFVSHNVHRDNYYTGLKGYEGKGIADQIITEIKPDVVIGGGHPMLNNPNFEPTKGSISRELYEALKSSEEYVFVEREAGKEAGPRLMEAAQTALEQKKKLFGLFGGSESCFETPVAEDRPGHPQVKRTTLENPSLAEAAVAALTYLANDSDGFFLLVEQGDIDWANHGNNYGRMVGAVWDLDQAVRAVVDYIEAAGDNLDWDNTLLLVTADHANSYMVLSPEKPLGKGDLPRQELAAPVEEGGYHSAFTYPDGEVSYGTAGHTNELVSLYARGKGIRRLANAEGDWYPGTRLIDQTHINAAMVGYAGLDSKD